MKTDPRKQFLKNILSGNVPASQAAEGLIQSDQVPVRFITFSNIDGVISGEGYNGLTEEELPGVVARMRIDLKANSYGKEPLLWVEVKNYCNE